jgi:hypothetical protein
MGAPITFTVSELIDLLIDAMVDHGGRTIRLSKGATGVVTYKVSADRGKDVRDFKDAKVTL